MRKLVRIRGACGSLLRQPKVSLRLGARWVALAAVAIAALTTGCGSTTDSLGDGRPPTRVLVPLKGPSAYPNLFKSLLRKTDTEIDSKVDGAFRRLFHGNPDTQAFYEPVGDAALIVDSYNGDQRTEGYGLAMLIAVELDKRDEFDRIWRGAQQFRYASGANQGYFRSVCSPSTNGEVCIDPYGLQQFVMALLLANDRWREVPSNVDYEKDASELLHLLLHKEDSNGGVVDGVTNTFEPKNKLVIHQPNVAFLNVTRPSLMMPAYYSLWAQATGDSFFLGAASAARSYLRAAAHDVTGLTPGRTDLDGTPLTGFDTFQAEGYRVALNLMLDYVWSGQANPSVAISDRLVTFFASQGKEPYGRAFTLDGVPNDSNHDDALVAANGMVAVAAEQNADRESFVQAVWDLSPPTGGARYYAGLMQLLSLLALSGKLQVY